MTSVASWPALTLPQRVPRAQAGSHIGVRTLVALHERIMGRRTLSLARALSESESVPAEELEAQRIRALRELVRHARLNCPYYRDLPLPSADTIQQLTDLERLPFLTREVLRECHRQAAWADAPNRLLLGHTHGSADEPVRFIWDRARQAWDKAHRLRGHAWQGFAIGDRELHLWPIDPPTDFAGRITQRLRDLRDACTAESQIDALAVLDGRVSVSDAWARWRVFNPVRVTAYPSVLCGLIERGTTAGIAVGNDALRTVFLTGEVTFDWQRRLIERVLGAPTVQGYGCQEVGPIAFECEAGTWHVCAESVIVEIIRAGRPAEPGELGEVVVTGLQSHAMPMIRYRTGDMVRAREAKRCSCGRSLPSVPPVLGRAGDFIRGADGKWHGPAEVMAVLSGVLQPGSFQIRQWVDGTILLRVLPGVVDAGAARGADDRLRKLLGRGVTIRHDNANGLERTLFGKCRYVAASLPPRP